jgi:hypothetical protein
VRFLVIGNMTAAATTALVRHGHGVVAAETLGIAADATAADILALANKHQLDVLTGDAAVARAPFDAAAGKFGRSIVLLGVAIGEVEQNDAIDRLFTRYPRLANGQLYVVTASRVKVRQLPGTRAALGTQVQ